MTILILLIIAVVFAVLWYRARGRARAAEELTARETIRANEAARRSAAVRELLEQSYVGLQAMAEKNLELEWARQDGYLLEPGVWVGDQFIPVEPAEAGDVEVGQPVGSGPRAHLERINVMRMPIHDSSLEEFPDAGPGGEAAEFGGTVPLSTEDTK